MSVDAAPAPLVESRRRGNFELYAWIFMRVSGVLLVLLVLLHFAIMHVVGGGLDRVNFAFVSGRWANPFWRVYDFAMLTLALLRSCFAADRTGHMILQTLYQQNVKQGTTFFDEFYVLDLLLADDRAAGVVAYELATGELHVFRAKSVVFCTGGFGKMFKITSNAQ